MTQTSSLDAIMQQLDALSLAELLQVRAKVDALIEVKSSYSNNFSSASYQRATSVYSNLGIVCSDDFGFAIVGLPRPCRSAAINSILDNQLNTLRDKSLSVAIVDQFTARAKSTWLQAIIANQPNKHEIVQISEVEANKDDSLEKLIQLVDEWMDEESGYDEETYPEIEAGLNQNHPSFSKLR